MKRFVISKKGQMRVSPFNLRQMKQVKFDLRKISGPIARATAMHVSEGHQPAGDSGTRRSLRDRKMNTKPSTPGYYGIVNIYEVAEPNKGYVVGKRAKTGDEVANELRETAAARMKREKKEAAEAKKLELQHDKEKEAAEKAAATEKGRPRWTENDVPPGLSDKDLKKWLKQHDNIGKTPPQLRAFIADYGIMRGEAEEAAGKKVAPNAKDKLAALGKTVIPVASWRHGSIRGEKIKVDKDNRPLEYEKIPEGTELQDYPDEVVYYVDGNAFYRKKSMRARVAQMRARNRFNPIIRPKVRLEPYIIRRGRW